MSPCGLLNAGMSLCFPRVSGDEPEAHAIALAVNKFSPRERG